MKVLITTSSFAQYDPEPLRMLEREGFQPLLNPKGRVLSTAELLAQAAGCVGIIAGTESYSAETLRELRDLRVISRCGAGLDGIDLDVARERGVAVLSTPYGPTQAVTELTLAMILVLIRQIHLCDRALRQGVWGKEMGLLIGELQFGILGLGKIGKRLAATLRAFEARVLGCDIQPDTAWAAAHQVTLRDRESILRESDVVCLHLPREPGLHHLIGKRELAMMKPGSYLVNTSRGGLIDEAALLQALNAGHIAGAALDVFEEEPYAGPLRQSPRVILTPHIGSYALSSRIKMEREAAENLIRALRETGRDSDAPRHRL